MKTFAFFVALLAASAEAFVPINPAPQASNLRSSPDEVDFDAPIERAAAVGNVVKAEKPNFLGVPVPPFIAKAFGVRLPYGDVGKNMGDDLLIELMDDECYLGKDYNLDECADFDPPAKP